MVVTGRKHTLKELIMMNSKSGKKRIDELRLKHEDNLTKC